MNDEANRMDCAQFGELSHDLDRPGTQGMALRESALVHAESCSRCAQLMTQAESLNFSLRSLARREAGAQAPLRVETALLEEFRRAKAGNSRRRTGLWVAALRASLSAKGRRRTEHPGRGSTSARALRLQPPSARPRLPPRAGKESQR